MESLRVYEGLQQHHRMSKALLPVAGEPFLAQRQYARGQIGNMILRKDQETAVIGHQVQAIILMAEVPSDPAIPCCTLQGCGGKAQKSDPFIEPGGDVPKGFADLGQKTQVMMLLHLFLVIWLFRWTNRADNDFLQVQDTQPPDEVEDMQRTHPFVRHLEEFVQNYMQLIKKLILISEDKITLNHPDPLSRHH